MLRFEARAKIRTAALPLRTARLDSLQHGKQEPRLRALKPA